MVFHISKGTHSAVRGLTATALVLINPVFEPIQVAVLPEIPMILFSLVSVSILNKIDERMRQHQCDWTVLCYFGLAAGLAVRCKLFAFSLFPTLAAVLLLHGRKITWRILPAFLLPSALGFGVFVLTNPLFCHGFVMAFRAMTILHIETWNGNPLIMHAESAKYALDYPFLFYSWLPLGIRPEIPRVAASMRPIVYAGYFLAVSGTVAALARSKFIPVFWMIFSFLLIAYVVSIMPAKWIVPKEFLLPAVSIAWVSSYSVGGLISLIQKRTRSRPKTNS